MNKLCVGRSGPIPSSRRLCRSGRQAISVRRNANQTRKVPMKMTLIVEAARQCNFRKGSAHCN
jgi:hypothetical protein